MREIWYVRSNVAGILGLYWSKSAAKCAATKHLKRNPTAIVTLEHDDTVEAFAADLSTDAKFDALRAALA